MHCRSMISIKHPSLTTIYPSIKRHELSIEFHEPSDNHPQPFRSVGYSHVEWPLSLVRVLVIAGSCNTT